MARLSTSDIVNIFYTGMYGQIDRKLTGKDWRALRKAGATPTEILEMEDAGIKGRYYKLKERSSSYKLLKNTPTIQEFKEGLGNDKEAKRMFGLTLKKMFNMKDITTEEQRAMPKQTQIKLARFIRDYEKGKLWNKLDRAIVGNFMGAMESQAEGTTMGKLVMHKLRQLTAHLTSDEIWILYSVDLPQSREFYKDKGRERDLLTPEEYVDNVNKVVESRIEQLKASGRWKKEVAKRPYYYDLYEGGFNEYVKKHGQREWIDE